MRPVVKRPSDTDIFVGLNCQECGKRVLVSDQGQTGGLWRTTSEGVKAWHLKCWEKLYERLAAR